MPILDPSRAIISLPVGRIRPMRDQPRKHFNRHKLKKLMASLNKAGQKLPVLVRPIEGDPKHDYELIDGERRWRSKRQLGAKTITCIVINAEDIEDYFEISAIANFGRENHTPLEIANALQRVRTRRIRKDGSCTEADLAEMFAQTETWVSHHLLLLKLTREVQAMMDPDLSRKERLTRTAAVQVSRLPARMQADFARRILRERMNLNQVRLDVRTRLQGRASADVPMVFRGRPVNRFRNLMTLLENFEKGASVLLGIPREELEEAMRGRSVKEVAQLRRLLHESGRKHQQIREVVDAMLGRQPFLRHDAVG